jgi:glucose/arabinose dehydrogenase
MTKFVPLVIIACAIAATAVTFVPSRAQNSSTAKAGTSSDPAALPDQELGRRFLVKPEDLPPPRTGPIVSNRPLTLAYHGQTPRVPEGFKATLFASGLQHPRRLLVLPNGDVLAESADRTGQHDRRALMRLRDGCGAEG